MSKHTRFDELYDTRRYDDIYPDALVALWRERYEEALRTGTPAPNLPCKVETAIIQSARRVRNRFIADVLSRGLRRMKWLLRTALRLDERNNK